MAYSLVALMRGLGISPVYYVGLTILFTVSPTTALYEHVPMQEYPVAVFLVLSCS